MIMTRSPLQILVFPYKFSKNKEVLFCLFKRNLEAGGYWQGIAGGGENAETPLEAAKRESYEEAGIPLNYKYMQLDSIITIPVVNILGFLWGENTLVIPEYSFAVELVDEKISLSNEHTEYRWFDYSNAIQKLHWDSNKNSLWELNHRLTGCGCSF